MTWEQLIAKAEEHARAAGIPVEQLHRPKVRATAVVSFISKNSRSTAKFHMDAVTGQLIEAQYSGPKLTPKAPGTQLSHGALRVLDMAREESKRMGCGHVGSDHLLLSLLVHGEGKGAAALLSSGLTAEAVRRRIAVIGPKVEVPTNGYGPSLHNILRLSSYYAETFNMPEIEPEHFVLALLSRVDGPAMNLLRHFGVHVERVKALLLEQQRHAKAGTASEP